MNGSFKFSPSILVRLGEELVPNPTDGLLELVKNAYDADASNCFIKFSGNAIIISDDGDGMTESDIIEGWLLIGGSRKITTKLTKKNRVPVGNKGLGRLAALRLGRRVRLISRSVKTPGKESSITIDWDKVDNSDFVEQEIFAISTKSTTEKPGTEIHLEQITRPLGSRDVTSLSRSLILLSDPFENAVGFYASIESGDFDTASNLAKENYFEDADYHLSAVLDNFGVPLVRVLDWQDRVMYESTRSDFSKRLPYRSPVASFDLWAFKLSNSNFSAKNSDVKDVKKWLSVVGGVHLYQSNMRVRPFGEPGYDWLEMDRKRVASPEERVSTNNSIGIIKVNDLGLELTQKTDRSGFVENEAFTELKRFAVDCLNWMANRRLGDAEVRRGATRTSSSKVVADAKKEVKKLIFDVVPKESRDDMISALEKLTLVQQQEAAALREDLQLYRSMATAGSTSAVFAHESHKPLSQILSLAKSIAIRGKSLLGDIFAAKLEEPISLLASAAQSLQLFSQLPLNLLKREKRRSEVVDIHASALELVSYLKPFFQDSKISLEIECSQQVLISGSRALIESILANLTLNALKAFDAAGSVLGGRIVRIVIFKDSDFAFVKVMDNGPGIRGIKIEDIWLPGRTTLPEGTGFGLTIVRDSVADLRGSQNAIANGELGGAEFTITLPLAK